MSAETATLKDRGQWRSGEKTLLGMLGIHSREALMCKGLAWILTPDGWHGLGTAFTTALYRHLGLPAEGVDRIRLTVEESRAETRADLVMRTSRATVVVEAKIYAEEQPMQCDRIAARWANESPILVFLTLNGSEPRTAIDSAGQWKLLSWRDLAALGHAVVASRPHEIAHGVYDLLETWSR